MLLLKSTQTFARTAFQRSMQTRTSSTMRAVDPAATIYFVYTAFMGTVLFKVVNESSTSPSSSPSTSGSTSPSTATVATATTKLQ
jgi:hypothetical protein